MISSLLKGMFVCIIVNCSLLSPLMKFTRKETLTKLSHEIEINGLDKNKTKRNINFLNLLCWWCFISLTRFCKHEIFLCKYLNSLQNVKNTYICAHHSYSSLSAVRLLHNENICKSSTDGVCLKWLGSKWSNKILTHSKVAPTYKVSI